MRRVLLLMVVCLLPAGCAAQTTPTTPATPTLSATATLVRHPTVVLVVPLEADLGDTWTRPTDGMEMVYVPAGEFEMGSLDAEIDAAFDSCEQDLGEGECDREWFASESPIHQVALDALWIDRTEVSEAQYASCVEAGVCREAGCAGGPGYVSSPHPVVCVSWYDAQRYCEWVGGRLPSEAEWEYASRGPDGFIYPWGDAFDGSRLSFCDTNCSLDWKYDEHDDGFSSTAPVASFPQGASWCGAYDMAGNVYEWVADWYEPTYYARSPYRNPLGPGSGESRVLRGGGWFSIPWELRCAFRDGIDPEAVLGNVGFRCSVSAGE